MTSSNGGILPSNDIGNSQCPDRLKRAMVKQVELLEGDTSFSASFTLHLRYPFPVSEAIEGRVPSPEQVRREPERN